MTYSTRGAYAGWLVRAKKRMFRTMTPRWFCQTGHTILVFHRNNMIIGITMMFPIWISFFYMNMDYPLFFTKQHKRFHGRMIKL